jgi:magnesium transporter
MIQVLPPGENSLKPVDWGDLPSATTLLNQAIWIDLFNPSNEEEEFTESILKLNIPTREEMHEIEESSRLFEEDGALYLSCWMLSYDSAIPLNTSVSFVITPKHFISLRYSDHHAFRIFQNSRKQRIQSRKFRTPDDAFVELLEAVVGHIASTLRLIEQDLNTLSVEIFAEQKEQQRKSKSTGLKKIVQRIGKRNSLVASLRESSISISTLSPFFVTNACDWLQPDLTPRLRTLERDIRSLREYDTQLSAEINFLLDSTVGLISIEQNQAMKVLSVAAVLVAFI